MKVAYVMSRFPKITETFVLYEMLALEELGAEVELFPLLRERGGPRHPEAERMVERARFAPFLSVEVVRANWHFFRRDPGGFLRLWRDVLAGTWGSANFFVGALGILPKCALFARRMERLGVDHVHAHFASHPAVAALAVSRLTGIPFSFTAHGSDLHVERRMLDRKVREAALVVTVSDYNRELIAAECGEAAREKVRVIHCGVDTADFAPGGDGGAEDEPTNGGDPASATGAGAEDEPGNGGPPHGPFRIVCVASHEEVKGHRFLLDACALLELRGVDFTLDLVGDGPLRSEVERRVEEAGLEERVRIRGALPRPAVRSLLERADAAVLSSHPTASGKREGIPVALMEAMASGLPVVASRVSGIPELVEHGRSGLLVRSGRPEPLADALETLAREPETRRRMGRAGRETVEREFDQERNAARLLEEIRGVGDRRPRSAKSGSGALGGSESGAPRQSGSGATQGSEDSAPRPSGSGAPRRSDPAARSPRILGVFALGAALIAADPACEPPERIDPDPTLAGDVWVERRALAELPASGPAWAALEGRAEEPCGRPDLSDRDSEVNVCVMAQALAFARTGRPGYRDGVVRAVEEIARGDGYRGRALALGRELAAYVIAADLVDLGRHEPALDSLFRARLLQLRRTPTAPGPDNLIECHEQRPNNWGTHCGASRVAVAAYLGDRADLDRAARVFRGWLGDRSAYAGFEYGDLSWQCDPERPVGINPAGCVRDGRPIGGVLPDDQRRGGDFAWPPPRENYVWEALQGALVQAVILERAGYPAFEWEDRALLRAVRWLLDEAGYPPEGDDRWQLALVNHYYGTSFPVPSVVDPGKNVGWTPWSHPAPDAPARRPR